jgi:hypothetical protein
MSQTSGPAERPLVGDLTPSEYLSERLDQYQSWYNGKAIKTKALFLRMRTVTVVGGACVPVLVNLDVRYMKIATTLVSLVVVALIALESVYHHREQWKNYRSTEQFLGHERIFYKTRSGAYEGTTELQAFRLLVERVETAIAAENAATLNTLTVPVEDLSAGMHGYPSQSQRS